jgi:hypothetical protein
MSVPEIAERYGLMLEAYLRGCGDQRYDTHTHTLTRTRTHHRTRTPNCRHVRTKGGHVGVGPIC